MNTERYSVYQNKDGRFRAYDKETKKIVSYPRIIMEEVLGRPLLPNEQVHHKDENPENNDPNNLIVLTEVEHKRLHNKKYYNREMICANCGETFIWTDHRQSLYFGNANRERNKDRIQFGPFCSKSCTGYFTRMVQLGRTIKPIIFED